MPGVVGCVMYPPVIETHLVDTHVVC